MGFITFGSLFEFNFPTVDSLRHQADEHRPRHSAGRPALPSRCLHARTGPAAGGEADGRVNEWGRRRRTGSDGQGAGPRPGTGTNSRAASSGANHVHGDTRTYGVVCARAPAPPPPACSNGRAGPVREDRDLRCVSVCARAGRPAFLFRFLFLPLSLSLLLSSSLSFLPSARPDSRAAGPVAPPFYQLALTQPEARGPCASGCDVGSKEAVGWHRGEGSRR